MEGVGEFVHQQLRPGVAMRLEDHVDLAITALPGCGQRGANLGGMMSVVVKHTHPGGLATPLETAFHSPEILERGTNLLDLDVEANSNRNRRRGIQNVVYARHVETELTKILATVRYVETADGLFLAGIERRLANLDLKIRAPPGSVSQRPASNLREQAA